MKNALAFCAIVFLLSCERDVDPDRITKMEYSHTGGFSGGTSYLVIDPNREVYVGEGKLKKCEKAIAAAEWSDLIEGFSWKEFKKLKSNNEPVCCDIGRERVEVTLKSRSHEVSWTFTKPVGVKEDFVKKLRNRQINLARTCP